MTTETESPFNGVWVLTWSSDFEKMMDALELDESVRKIIRKSLTDFGAGALTETWHVDEKAGTVSRKVCYGNHPERESANVPFGTMHTTKYFDGRPVQYVYEPEQGRRYSICRFEIANNNKCHTMVITEVKGNKMTSSYTCRGKTYIKKFEKRQ